MDIVFEVSRVTELIFGNDVSLKLQIGASRKEEEKE